MTRARTAGSPGLTFSYDALPVVLPLALIFPLWGEQSRLDAARVTVRLLSSATKPNSTVLVRTSVLSLFLAGTARGNSLRPADARSASGFAGPTVCGPSKTIQRPNDGSGR